MTKAVTITAPAATSAITEEAAMRPDKQKQQPRQEPAAKDRTGEMDDRNEPEAASRSARGGDSDALAKMRDREHKGPTIH